MVNDINELEPKLLWQNFARLCAIPRPSKHEEKVIEFVISFALQHHLNYKTDATGNIAISKPATQGYEQAPVIVLQTHLDMVPQKNNDTIHDFLNDPIDAYIDGDWVAARGTTLGADDGIGVAAALAVLESTDINHGPIEALFTIDEETGMTGANNLTPGFIKGRILLNLDSEDEGQLYIGCAGGANTTATFTFQPNAVPDDYVVIQISLTGLRGGHSGVDIHLGRGNANKIMNDLLLVATSDFGLRIASINGGSLRNAIPRESVALAVVPSGNLVNLIDWFETYKQIIIDKFSAAESEISIALNQIDSVDSIMDITTQNNLLNAVRDIPDGVITMSESVSGIVETSNNLAIISTHDNMIEVACMLRSLVDVSRDELADRLLNIFQSNNSQAVNSGVYPGWKPNVNSPVLGNMKSIYQRQFGNSPEIKVIHAGLECGIIGDKYPGMDMISFGPTIRHPHSPDEKVNIVSVEKFWSYLCEVLSSKISNQII